MTNLLIFFGITILFKTAIESLNRLVTKKTAKFKRYLYLRFLVLIALFLMHVDNQLLLISLLPWFIIGLFLIGLISDTKTTLLERFKQTGWFTSRHLLTLIIVASVVVFVMSIDTPVHYLFVILGIWAFLFMIYLGIMKVAIFKFFDTIPYKHPLDDKTLEHLYPKLNEEIYMIRGKRIRLPMNALFTGIFRRERVLISDKLLSRLSSKQTKAIILHEFGHYAHKHLFKRLMLLVLVTGMLLGVFILTNAQATYREAFMVFVMAGYVGNTIVELVLYRVTQYQEYEADKYAAKYSDKNALKEALKHIDRYEPQRTAHPLYQKLFNSHPSLEKRLMHIDNLSKRN